MLTTQYSMRRTHGASGLFKKMKITILTDNPNSWIIPFAEELEAYLKDNHKVKHVFKSEQVEAGDILFILSCEKLVKSHILKLNKNNIVVHPSDLPKQRGWSPLTWQVLEGKNIIPICLFEAHPISDGGGVYVRDEIKLDGSELNSEMKQKQGETTLKMIKKYLKEKDSLLAVTQTGEPSYCNKITPEDSEININKSIKDQFNRLRVVDNERYPAFFKYKNSKYIIKIYRDK